MSTDGYSNLITNIFTIDFPLTKKKDLLPEEDVDELMLIALRLCLCIRLTGEAYLGGFCRFSRFLVIGKWMEPLFPKDK